jgi:hypothetical protein
MSDSMKILKDAGVNDLLYKAADILESRGYTHKATHNVLNGAIDVEGALLLACGVKFLPPIVRSGVDVAPDHMKALFYEALLTFGAVVHGYGNWVNAPHTTSEAVGALRQTGDIIDIAIG